MSVTILQGDALEVLRGMADESVHMCCTSPPYWGLRDYGTATWEGGDDGCDHLNGPLASTKSTLQGYTGDHVKLAVGGMPYRDTCAKCGARRIDAQMGLEKSPEEYVEKMVEVFREVRRVLRSDGVLFCNLGDSYSGGGQGGHKDNKAVCGVEMPKSNNPPGLKPKDLVGIPWRVAFALQADGWWLRQDIIWSKPNPMPESVTDRCCKSHEYLFLLSKSPRYWFDSEAIKEPTTNDGKPMKTPDGWDTGDGAHGTIHRKGRSKGASNTGIINGRNKRSVWTVATAPFTGWSRTVHWERVGLDAVSGGMMRIASPDCQAHGYQDFRYDGHGAYFLNHNSCIDSSHVRGREDVEIYNLSNLDEQKQGCSLDFQSQNNALFAISHNTETHKKDHALLTNPSCSVCGKTLLSIGDIQAELVKTGLGVRISESNIWPAVLDDLPLVQTLFRIVRKSSLPIPPKCLCAYYHKKVSKSSHFATFPPKLIEPCILAGCPDKCCPTCGQGWERVVEKTKYNPEIVDDGVRNVDKSRGDKTRKLSGAEYNKQVSSKTLGFRPACACGNEASVPGVVLDPFGGSGTVGMVAEQNGRNSILIELNPKYVEMAKRRTAQKGLFT